MSQSHCRYEGLTWLTEVGKRNAFPREITVQLRGPDVHKCHELVKNMANTLTKKHLNEVTELQGERQHIPLGDQRRSHTWGK